MIPETAKKNGRKTSLKSLGTYVLKISWLVLAVIVDYSGLPWGLGVQPLHVQWVIVLNGNRIQPLVSFNAHDSFY